MAQPAQNLTQTLPRWKPYFLASERQPSFFKLLRVFKEGPMTHRTIWDYREGKKFKQTDESTSKGKAFWDEDELVNTFENLNLCIT